MWRIVTAALLVIAVSLFVLASQSRGFNHGVPVTTGFLPTCTSTDSSGNPITCPAGVAFRDWRYLQGNANNPVVHSNTGTYNAVNMGNPYLAPQNLINGVWYGFGQCSAAGADLGSFTGYRWICLTHSSDLVHWTNDDAVNPVISFVPNTWMDRYLLKPMLSPTCNLARYCLYFSAMDQNNIDSIGLYLADTITGPWTPYSGNPVIPGSAGCVGNHQMLPSLLQIGNTKYMYTAYHDNTGQTIAYWTAPASSDTAWTCGASALRAPVAGDWDVTGAAAPYGKTVSLYGIVDPFVWKNKHGFYEMLYTAATDTAYIGCCVNVHGGQAVGYAVSADAINWYKYTPYPVVSLEANYPGQSVLASSCGDPTANNGTAGNNSVVEVGDTLYYTPICVNGGWLFTMPDY